MATGAFLDGRCYGSNAEAVDVFYSGVPPSLTAGVTSYLAEYLKVGGVWKVARYSVDSAGATVALTEAVAPVPVFPVCDTMERFVDGQAIGWGCALILIAAWCVKTLHRGM